MDTTENKDQERAADDAVAEAAKEEDAAKLDEPNNSQLGTLEAARENVSTNANTSRKRVAIICILLFVVIAAIVVPTAVVLSNKEEYYERWYRECLECKTDGVAFCREQGCYYGDCASICWNGGSNERDWTQNCDTDSEELKECVDQGVCESDGCDNYDYEQDVCSRACSDAGWCTSDFGTDCNGRPFRQGLHESPILAGITTDSPVQGGIHHDHDIDVYNNPWSQPLPLTFADPAIQEGSRGSNNNDQWIQRALGEHASIASFAAFVIALMTHAAPPHLIEQALVAAQDELRHARLAFAQAAAGGGSDNKSRGLGPSELPASNLHFSYNLTDLAMSVAQEGCIEETLSALALAKEASSTDTTYEPEKILLTSIAMDEARHAGLAWRTVRWVCESDRLACETVLHCILHEDRLDQGMLHLHGALEKEEEEGSNDDVVRDLFGFLKQWLTSADPRKFCLAHSIKKNDHRNSSANGESTAVERVAAAIQNDVCLDHHLSSPSRAKSST